MRIANGGENTDGLEMLYMLNLMLTLGMFAVLIFRAWIELKNYRLMWKELEWRQTYQAVGRILKAEKDLFSKVEGGDELYRLLCEIFKVRED
ncbi:MAG: hypothetical protein QXJ11_01025 [Candidatus Bathyarchaeia archaeon]